jgi:hypothetical protein
MTSASIVQPRQPSLDNPSRVLTVPKLVLVFPSQVTVQDASKEGDKLPASESFNLTDFGFNTSTNPLLV